MSDFVDLIKKLDSSTRTSDKLAALELYFQQNSEAEIGYMVALFLGRKPSRIGNSRELRAWVLELVDIPEWLFEESYAVVGDLSETLSHLLPERPSSQTLFLAELIPQLEKLKGAAPEERKAFMQNLWLNLDKDARFVVNKLGSGGFRIGVSSKLVMKALAKFSGQEEGVIAHRLMGNWHPSTQSILELIREPVSDDLSKPYPFFLASPLEELPAEESLIQDWLAEYKWDGIRVQFIKRKGNWFLWSRGEELINESFPEFEKLAVALPEDVVIDGELMVFENGLPASFQRLQKRLGRKNPGKKIQADYPVRILAYDLLERNQQDLREEELHIRRSQLEALVDSTAFPELLGFSESIAFSSQEHLETIRLDARKLGSEGLMLKRANSSYQSGRKRGDWYKWKLDPFTVDAVLIYAQAGHGRRANLYTDYTFALKNSDDNLIPVAKAYSGLTDAELIEIDAWIKANTYEKFGPVRSVKAELVFEIGFEGIAESSRHKSGIAVRFPRIIRWRKDKSPGEINNLDDLKCLIGK
ncbi:MAG: ATP-dependent DNA ligase [Bacteroidia bacterium]|nr:ATP-dependent DNA ligase [Bacteroidia bacterium]